MHARRVTRGWAVVLTFGFLLSLLAGCGSGSGGDKANSGSRDKASPSGKVSLEVWTPENRDADVAANKALLAAFREKRPDIDVNFSVVPWDQYLTKIQAAQASGTMPDIYYQWGTNPADDYWRGISQPIDDIVQAIGESNFNEVDRTAVKADGHYTSLPLYSYGHVLWYRKDWLKAKNLPAPRTWDEWRTVMKAFTGDKKYGTLVYNKSLDAYYVMDLMIGAGAEVFDAKGAVTIESQGTADALAFMKEMLQYSPPGPSGRNMDDANLMFLADQAATTIGSPTFLNVVVSQSPDKLPLYGVVPVPSASGNAPNGLYVMSSFGVSKSTKNRDAVKEFLTFWYSKDVMKTYMTSEVLGFVPSFLPVTNDPGFLSADRIKPVADFYKEMIQAAKNNRVIGQEHGPNKFAGKVYNDLLYTQMGDKVINGDDPKKVVQWAGGLVKDTVAKNQ
jgi:multiple sugar transport system substrate-binding protein